jgi:hypothetical protein
LLLRAGHVHEHVHDNDNVYVIVDVNEYVHVLVDVTGYQIDETLPPATNRLPEFAYFHIEITGKRLL